MEINELKEKLKPTLEKLEELNKGYRVLGDEKSAVASRETSLYLKVSDMEKKFLKEIVESGIFENSKWKIVSPSDLPQDHQDVCAYFDLADARLQKKLKELADAGVGIAGYLPLYKTRDSKYLIDFYFNKGSGGLRLHVRQSLNRQPYSLGSNGEVDQKILEFFTETLKTTKLDAESIISPVDEMENRLLNLKQYIELGGN